MKTIITTSLLMVSSLTFYGQTIDPRGQLIFSDTLSFEPLNSWISVSDSGKLWEIGIPDKEGMKDTYDGFPGIVTNLRGNYGTNSNDTFVIDIPYYQYIWGEGVLSFWHRYDTDSLKDGGFIEISHDNGLSWENLVNDASALDIYDGLYTVSDTIAEGIPAFTGNSAGWQKVELYWFWFGLTKHLVETDGIKLRFHFLSGSNSVPKGGWELSHFEFRGYSPSGGIGNNPAEAIKVWPNPAYDKIRIQTVVLKKSCRFQLFDGLGLKMLDVPVQNIYQEVSLGQIKKGVYLYTISSEEGIISSGKIIRK